VPPGIATPAPFTVASLFTSINQLTNMKTGMVMAEHLASTADLVSYAGCSNPS
jgi:hypothetical protein